MNKILEFLFPRQRTNLEIVSDYINKYGVTNAIDTNPVKDQYFRIGPYLLQFGDHDTICQLKVPNDTVPMFIFNDEEEIKQLREVLTNNFTNA